MLIPPGGSFAAVLEKLGPDLAPTMLAALGLTGIVQAGAIDLSIGAVVAVAASVFGVLAVHDAPPPLAWLACLATAWALAAANGWLVRHLRLPAIIVTLGGLVFYRGIAAIVAELGVEGYSGILYLESRVYGPDAYQAPGRLHAGWILLGAALAALAWEWSAALPRRWLALGSSGEACRLQGLRPAAILQSAFSAGGLFLGLAALTAATRVQAIQPESMLRGFELDVIGAVVVGGTNIFGGEGCYAGTILGCSFFYLLSQLLTYAGISEYYRQVVIGGAIIAVIGADCLLHRREKLLEELR
jgi:ribose/xylose/arabinose/galactoside ABC-type transport system permease subunit